MGVVMRATNVDPPKRPVKFNWRRNKEIARKAALAQHRPARLDHKRNAERSKLVGITMHATDAVEYDPGVYRARLQKVDEQESQFTDDATGEPKWQYIWTFELLEEGYEGNTLTGWSSTNFGPRAKARAWAEALVGRQITSGENIAGDDLVGKECDLMITLKTGDRGTFAKIESVNPVRKKKGKKESPTQAPSVPEEDLDDAPF